MKYLDLVELIKEKPAYTKAGVKIGDFVGIMSKKQLISKNFLIIRNKKAELNSAFCMQIKERLLWFPKPPLVLNLDHLLQFVVYRLKCHLY